MIDGLGNCHDAEEWERLDRQVRRCLIGFGVFLAVVALLVIGCVMARADTVALSNCSQTVGASATAVAFPASGSAGPTLPSRYLQICNAHASNTLGVNFSGGTASIGAAGTVTLNPGGCQWWNTEAIPAALSIIGSAGSTTTACGYK